MTLAQLQALLTRLMTKADNKIAEVTEDMAADAVRAIEADHEKILAEIEDTKARIAEKQAELEADDNPDAGDAADTDTRHASTTSAQAADILNIGTRAGMETEAIETAIRDGMTVDQFRAAAFDHMAGQADTTQTSPARIQRDESETRHAGMVAAMAFRMGADQPEGEHAEMARSFMEFRDVVEFAAAFTNHRGRINSAREREDVLHRAFHTASDFPAIFSDAINTRLEARYGLATPTYRRISRRRDFMDFRPHFAVGIGEFPMLEKLTDTGEIKFGTFGESKEQIAVVPYAKGIRVSRQMLVNDRLGTIGEVMGGYGRTVARFEELSFYAMMKSAQTKLADGKVVFHADHNNLAAAGGGIDVASVGLAKTAMRKQKNLDDATMNVEPSILLVSAERETEALQYLAPIMANDSVKVNPHVGTLTPVVASELDANPWYLFADPEDVPVYQWGLLDGYEAPRVRFDEPFGTQGIAMTVEHDFGVGAVDFRGAHKNAGA